MVKQLRDKKGRFLKRPKSVGVKANRYYDRKTSRFISHTEAQRRARIAKRKRYYNYIVKFSTFMTRLGETTETWMEFELIVKATSFKDAINIAYTMIGIGLPVKMEGFWEGHHWSEGVSRTINMPRQIRFRKFVGKGGPVIYDFSF